MLASNLSLAIKCGVGLIAILNLLFIAGCGEEQYDTTFYDGVHIHETKQKVKVEIPPNATNIYLTTNNKDPSVSDKCRFTPGIITIDRPTVVKLRYDLDGITYRQRGIYVIQDNIQESRYGNRVAIDIFELFIRNHVNPSFGPTPIANETKTLTDDQGGTVTRATTIEGFFNIVGKQNLSFNNYQHYDKDNDTYFIAKSGRIFGSKNKNGGFFNSDVDGERLVFAGTFNGNADGNFYIGTDDQRYSGYYRTFCSDRWCAPGDVFYVLDSFREFVEIYPAPTDKPRSCD